MQQEVELELGHSEAGDTGGVEHQSRADREGVGRERRSVEQAARRVTDVDREQGGREIELPGGGGENSTPAAERERGPGPTVQNASKGERD